MVSVSKHELESAMKLDKHYLSLAGEYRVCSEILKRGIHATITYGNHKSVDILAVGKNRRAAVIEVKSSNSCRFVTRFYQTYKTTDCEHPDFWILYSVCDRDGEFTERFFILTHAEMAKAQAQRNDKEGTLDYAALVEKCRRGVDNVTLENVKQYECVSHSQWDKIMRYCNDPIGRRKAQA
jgi:hypothetical protein